MDGNHKDGLSGIAMSLKLIYAGQPTRKPKGTIWEQYCRLWKPNK